MSEAGDGAEAMTLNTRLMRRICRRCGLTWGAHRNGDGLCPGHEGRMDWDAGPGTRFEYAGYQATVPHDTAAWNDQRATDG